jgi:hypothetical protein
MILKALIIILFLLMNSCSLKTIETKPSTSVMKKSPIIIKDKKAKVITNSPIGISQIKIKEKTKKNNKILKEKIKKVDEFNNKRLMTPKNTENQKVEYDVDKFISLKDANPPSWIFGNINRTIDSDKNVIFRIGSGYKTKDSNKFYESENMARQKLVIATKEFKNILISEIDKEIVNYSDLGKQEFIKMKILIELLSATILSKSKIIRTWQHPKRRKNFALASINFSSIESEIKKFKTFSNKVKNLFSEKYKDALNKTKNLSEYTHSLIKDGIEYENINGSYFIF